MERQAEETVYGRMGKKLGDRWNEEPREDKTDREIQIRHTDRWTHRHII